VEIETMRDRKNKLQSQLYEYKTTQYIREKSISRCSYCGKLFSQNETRDICDKAPLFIDFHGKVIARHSADKDWRASHCARYMNVENSIPYRRIYWRIWGCVNKIFCTACNRHRHLLVITCIHARYFPPGIR